MNSMKKKVIKLNEAQFRNMISKTIKRILKENAEACSCIDCDDCNDFNLDDLANDFEPDQEALDMAPKMPHHFKRRENADFNDYLGQI
jgi:hypothetical protein